MTGLFLPSLFLLTGCTELVEGTVTGDVPKGAQVLLLWPEDNALGVVGGKAEVKNGKFELRAAQPAAVDALIEPEADGLDLGELGHQPASPQSATVHERRRAWRRSRGSGATQTGVPTASSMGRSL